MTGTRGGTAHDGVIDRDGEAKRSPDGLTDRRAVWTGVPGARTPEELETLLEDALVIRDPQALAALFEEGAVLVAGNDRPARGGEEIARLALVTWTGDHTYVADPQRVMQARDIALVVTERGINVARRGQDGAWQYAIVLLSVDNGVRRREQ